VTGALHSTGGRRRRQVPWWCWIALIVLVEALIVMIFLPTPWTKAVGNGDGAEYQRYAFNLLHHGVFSESPVAPYYPGVVRSPGYPAFLALLELIGGRHAVLVQAVQFGLIAAMAILVGLVGREVAGSAVGNVAALLCATYLPFLGLATVFLTEVLTGCLLTAVVLLLLRARRTEGLWIYAAIGLVLAVATYIRPDSALLAAPIGLILVFSRSVSPRAATRWTAGVIFAAAMVIPLVPWVARDASVTGGKLVPLEAESGVSLLASADEYNGFLPNGMANVSRLNAQVARIVGVPATATRGIQASGEYQDARRQVEADNQERSEALTLFKSISAATIVKSLPKRIIDLWTVADVSPPPKGGTVWHRLAQLQWLLLLIVGVIGFAVRWRTLLDDWPLWFVGAYLTVTHLIFPIEARYTLLARPMLMIYAAVGAITVGAPLLRRVGRPAWPSGSVNSA
jgi:4-amino-4-deoxy-L-arabinose transferase-like glycosyltransferase